jgi:hypothetical protein
MVMAENEMAAKQNNNLMTTFISAIAMKAGTQSNNTIEERDPCSITTKKDWAGHEAIFKLLTPMMNPLMILLVASTMPW